MKECGRCGGQVDRTACGEVLTIYTIKDDLYNNPETTHQHRGYLCTSCSLKFELWLMEAEKI